MDKPKDWNSVEESDRWITNFRRWLIALLELMRTQIHGAQTDVLLPERIVIERTIAALHESGSDYPYLIDDDFSYAMRKKLQAIATEILAHEQAAGQRHSRQRRIVENAVADFQTIALIEM